MGLLMLDDIANFLPNIPPPFLTRASPYLGQLFEFFLKMYLRSPLNMTDVQKSVLKFVESQFMGKGGILNLTT